MSNFAIVACGGKQYGVTEGDTIRVESLPGDEGDTLSLSDVKLLSLDGVLTLGTPNVKSASAANTPLYLLEMALIKTIGSIGRP